MKFIFAVSISIFLWIPNNLSADPFFDFGRSPLVCSAQPCPCPCPAVNGPTPWPFPPCCCPEEK